MRKALPDLFDAQPDLLFHLVTMLNPSVLQANGVPVYSVMQVSTDFFCKQTRILPYVLMFFTTSSR